MMAIGNPLCSAEGTHEYLGRKAAAIVTSVQNGDNSPPTAAGSNYLGTVRRAPTCRSCHARFPPQTAKRWPGFCHKPRNQKLCGRNTPETGVRYILINKLKNGARTGMNVMLSDSRHWLEYDFVALAVLLAGIGFVELIVLSI